MIRVAQLHTDFGVHTSAVVYDKAGSVHAVRCSNKNAAVRYLQLFDSFTAPAAGDIPTIIIALPATTAVAVGNEFFSEVGLLFKNGISWGISTTETTFTAAAAADQVTHIVWSRW